jgi:hypothetical protein
MKRIIIGVLALGSLSVFAAKPCGLTGTVNQRIIDCGNQEREGFILVTRVASSLGDRGKEFYKEISSGLIWSFRYSSPVAYSKTREACQSIMSEMPGTTDMNWRLPTIKEFENADKSGIRQALPSMNFTFWTKSTTGRWNPDNILFNGVNGKYDYVDSYDSDHLASVRCVAN